MKLDSITSQVYIVAINEAKLQTHEYVTPEHFLYAALMFDYGKTLIKQSGGNIENMKLELMDFFKQNIPCVQAESPTESYDFIRLVEIATNHVRSCGKDNITVGDIIASMFNLTESYAAYILIKNGTDRLELLRNLSHGAQFQTEQQSDTNFNERNSDILDKLTVNLTQKAKEGKLDPLVGREDILNRTIQVLSRRLKNNPIHVGDAGVGKTAVVEGLAQKIVNGDVPDILKNSNIFYIDMGLVVAGTKFRGDFEERLFKILEAVLKTENPIVYLDEIHTIVGAGAVSGGGMDASGILKPFFSRGDIRFIGSTTFEDYKKYFEKDRALTRRFQKIDIVEPSIDESILILQGLKEKYENFHKVTYTDEIIKLICELTSKYIRDRFLPDKAIDVMDETGASKRVGEVGSSPYIIAREDIENTIALMSRVPMNTVSVDETDNLKQLSKILKKQIYGQNEAIETVVDAIKLSRSGLAEMEKPVANLLFVGPTGVGKTEIAKQLAQNLNVKLLRFDMSEYQEKHSVARLIGSPPGYVGYEEGGILTEAIRKTPYAVLLLDEIEKAHADILNIMLQIMDYGVLTDNIGKKADFRNVIIIMTSNAGARDMGKKVIGFEDKSFSKEAVDKEIEKIFSPEFRNRLDAIIVFNHIDKEMAMQIARKCVNKLKKVLEKKNIDLKFSKEAMNYMAEKGLSQTFGAREIIRVVDGEIKKMLAEEVLFGRLKNGGVASVILKEGEFALKVNRKP